MTQAPVVAFDAWETTRHTWKHTEWEAWLEGREEAGSHCAYSHLAARWCALPGEVEGPSGIPLSWH